MADGADLRVAGDVTVTGTFNAGTSTLTLDGTAAQLLNLGGSPLNDLTLTNAAGALLGADLEIGGTLDLVAGTLTIGAHRLTIDMPIVGLATNLVADASSSLTVAGTVAGIGVPASITDLTELEIINPAGTSLDGPLTSTAHWCCQAGTWTAGRTS